jgi:hypothetical protein
MMRLSTRCLHKCDAGWSNWSKRPGELSSAAAPPRGIATRLPVASSGGSLSPRLHVAPRRSGRWPLPGAPHGRVSALPGECTGCGTDPSACPLGGSAARQAQRKHASGAGQAVRVRWRPPRLLPRRSALWHPTKPGGCVGRGWCPQRSAVPRRPLTTGCRRRQTASARASLPLSAAPEPQR